ncbi:hypothetical protein JJV70_09040 [Streptomyces sp. JJ66]|uniref:hypothetical protein n=1 Tax=Streptomyces sp. JJ66 TaxID=2803843 RepID=UPI001C56E8C0|nr:hypothetical protein [Streptomyces sp. JJ66]MBW1602254.1 hypothetical protein [Streptomyces sp. JJ66]
MPRRVSLPAADELFRTTGGPGVQPSPSQSGGTGPQAEQSQQPRQDQQPRRPAAPEEHSGRGDRADGGGREAPAPRPASRPAVPGQPGSAASAPRGGTGAPSGGRQPAPAGAGGNPPRRRSAPRRPSGRERHDEKITVYVSAEELMDLEHARLVLRGEHGLAVDRGRIVREAVAVVLADLEARGDASILVRRLRG